MMYSWYKIFNYQAFLDTGLTSREQIEVLEGVGRVSILISRGNVVSISYNGAFMPINMLEINPFRESPYASYLDANGDVWLGIEVPE